MNDSLWSVIFLTFHFEQIKIFFLDLLFDKQTSKKQIESILINKMKITNKLFFHSS